MRDIDRLELQLKDSIRWKILKTRVKNIYNIDKEKLLQDIYCIRYLILVNKTFDECDYDENARSFAKEIYYDFSSRHSFNINYIKELFNFLYNSNDLVGQSDKELLVVYFKSMFQVTSLFWTKVFWGKSLDAIKRRNRGGV